MSKLEQLTPNAAVRGILPDGLVTVVSVQWFGSEALELTYKSANGKVANELLYRHDEARVEKIRAGRSIISFAYREDMARIADALFDHKTAASLGIMKEIWANARKCRKD